MNDDERRTLAALRPEWSPTGEDVWSSPPAHVDGLNPDVTRAVFAAFDQAEVNSVSMPVGVVIEGQHGSGKTHMLSWIREQVQRRAGYFFLLGMPHGRGFWDTLVQAYLGGLMRPADRHRDQLTMLLDGLAERADVSIDLRAQVTGRAALTVEGLGRFVEKVRAKDPRIGKNCQFTLRALVLFGSAKPDLQDLGEAFLISRSDRESEDSWASWGLLREPKKPQETLQEISQLLTLTGPCVLAVDQIDPVFAHARRSTTSFHLRGAGSESSEKIQLAEDVGNGLMSARELLSRTVIVVACLPTTWTLIRNHALESTTDRFRQESRLSRIPSPSVGENLIRTRFAPRFAAAGFKPPFPTWPIAPEAFDDAQDYTPRLLLQRVDRHIRDCLNADKVSILTDLSDSVIPLEKKVAVVSTEQAAAFEARLSDLKKQVQVDSALVAASEDRDLPEILVAGLSAYVREQGGDTDRYDVKISPGGSTTVHAMLKETIDEASDDCVFWYFRGLASTHHAAVRPRIERVRRFVSLDPAAPQRKAILLRNGDWPRGPVTKLRVDEFLAEGGVHHGISVDDLKTFSALGTMLREADPLLDAWLASARPASRTTLFTDVFGPQSGSGDVVTDPPTDPGGPSSGHPQEQPGTDTLSDEESLAIGSSFKDGSQVRVSLLSLRKHAVIFAGSGSGKTVLIRRLIEECALRGVSTIALDPNNDLARLGDPWPEAPASWGIGDEQRAKDYLNGTDVVVWTPRRESGRPLSLQPLPDFSAVMDDPDEFELALDTAVAALAPRARMGGNTAKMDRGKAVLREAMSYYARRGGSRLTGFVDLLAELPDDVTSLSKAAELAHDMGQTLTAAMINDPLFGGSGVPLDPGILLTPSPGRRARISVISLVGLPTNEQRQSFVNQLQMALFAWIKQHPAGDRPLGGLFVMDEAQTLAPSGAMTACTESTLALASQARKYGLGMIFATQAPRGIHNRIVGNAATQFYGFLNSQAQIAAAKEMASAKASNVLDISRLSAGQFYAVGEGLAFQKLATPMCLSHHPNSALTTEEVLERARA